MVCSLKAETGTENQQLGNLHTHTTLEEKEDSYELMKTQRKTRVGGTCSRSSAGEKNEEKKKLSYGILSWHHSQALLPSLMNLTPLTEAIKMKSILFSLLLGT